MLGIQQALTIATLNLLSPQEYLNIFKCSGRMNNIIIVVGKMLYLAGTIHFCNAGYLNIATAKILHHCETIERTIFQVSLNKQF